MQITELIHQNLRIFNIQRSSFYDGPGIRTTIFFRGCNLKCLWCQNPEGQSFNGNGNIDCSYSIDDILEIVLRDKEYYSASNGGVTLSGGEPFLQNPDSLIHLLELFKKEKIHIAIETSLHAPWKNINKVAPYIDLFLVDLKVAGNDDLHKKYTGQNSEIIYDNIKKLIDLGANIKFRTVIVPGYTDTEENIKAMSEFLKSIGYNSIELLKFHNMYEDKARRLGIDFIPLNITPEQSTASLKNGIKLFEKYGIKAESAELETFRRKAEFTKRVKEIQKAIRGSKRALCIEAAKLKTKYYRKNGFKKPVHIHRAERLSYVLRKKKVIIYPNELLVGNFTSKRVAGQLWEEYYGALPSKFLYKIGRQKPVSFHCSFKDKLYCYLRIFPFWAKYSLLNRVYSKITDFISGISRTSEVKAGFNNNMAGISHYIVNFERLLKLGTSGIIKEIEEVRKAKPQNNQDFYEGMIISLKGLEAFAEKYAKELYNLSKKEKNPERRSELEEMAKICEHVPKYPARTFHEALQSMLFLHIALCIESYENAISFGRLDQLLYPYYKRDLEAGRITYEKAKELLCLFILKMDEVIFVNDGDSFLTLYKLFETLSTDQAVTFGGVDKDGNDAVNDITYMLIDACELQTLSLDLGARIHKNSPPEYLKRIAEVYLNGSPIPQLFNDEIYIKTLMKHYPTTLENARNYSIVGCVEPVASDDHFANTDCANMNLPLAFLQALKGQDYDLWNNDLRTHLLVLITNYLRYIFKGKNRFSRFILRVCDILRERNNIKRGHYNYNPPSSMDELIDRFQNRLNQLAKGVLTDHQKIEKILRENFTTPLASALFKGCIESGKDLYEGGATFNSSGIQAVGVTDVADSLYAIEEVVFKKKLYTIEEIIKAIDANFQGSYYQKIREALLSVPKFGDDSSQEAVKWVNKVLEIYNNALDSVPNCPRNGRYSAGYYALNVGTIYGKKTPALPSGRLKGVPLANSIIPHYGMEQSDLLSSLNSIASVDFAEHAENGTTATLTIDAAMFMGRDGAKYLAALFKTFLMKGGMQLQPNVINREILLDAYKHPEKYPNLLVRVAGYCAYFNELSDEMKKIIINRTCYT
ncbi:MAG: pyruvate formate lyase family protein [Promethearchaeia archaeon]